MTNRTVQKYFSVIAMLAIAITGRAVTFEGVSRPALEYKADSSSGLSAVYVLSNTGDARAVFDAGADGTAKVYKFSTLGAAYAEETESTSEGGRIICPLEAGDMGYIVESRGRREIIWIIDYSKHELNLASLSPAPEQECGWVSLEFNGNAAEIPYYTVNGRRMVLSRELSLEYNTLVFDEGAFAYKENPATVILASAGNTIPTDAPLCSTSFRLSGDRFLKEWGEEESVESSIFPALSVCAVTRATQLSETSGNEQKTEGIELGGSAPCSVSFESAVTDEAIFREWQMSRDPDFGIVENTFSDLQFSYEFRENGRTYVRFVANNSEGTCEFTGPTYEVFIGESKLDIPNAFSPGSSPGVNDEWKVSYRSLVEYECHIFNRWGKELFSSTNPAEGWDGRSGGRYVPSGVYFYVIKARGADGVDYNRAGDINIIRSTGGKNSVPTE